MMRKFCLHLPFILCFLCIVAVFGATSHASDHQEVFSDQNFFTEDWTPLVHVLDDPNVAGPPPLTSTGSITRQTTGGNPGAYLRSVHSVNFGDGILTTGIYIDESYDPRQGAISTIDYSYSVNHFSANGNTNARIALLQSGQLFLASVQSFSGNQWVQRTDSGLNADDFLAVDSFITGAVIRPDFSAFGDPIQFGYSFGNVFVPGGGPDSFVRGMDNWSVTLNLAALSDIHGDGVDSVDLGFWSTGFGIASEALLTDGDFDLDGNVDGADFLQWQREFGSGVSTLAAATTVPEPSSLNLLALLAAGGGCIRRRLFRRRSE